MDPPPSILPGRDLLAVAAAATRCLVVTHSRHFLALSSLLLLPLSFLLVLPSPLLPAIGSSSSPAAPSVSLRSPLAYPRWSSLPASLPRFRVSRPRSSTLLRSPPLRPARTRSSSVAPSGSSPRSAPCRCPSSVSCSPPSRLSRSSSSLFSRSPPLSSVPTSLSSASSSCPRSGPSPAPPRSSNPPLGSPLSAGATGYSRARALPRSSRSLSSRPASSSRSGDSAGTGTYHSADGWAGMALVVGKAVAGTALLALLMLYGMVTNVVLYMHCRALHGELTGEIYNEFADMYVFLPFDDDGRNWHIVSVVTVIGLQVAATTKLQFAQAMHDVGAICNSKFNRSPLWMSVRK